MIERFIPQIPLVYLDYKPSKIKNKIILIPGFLSQKLAYYIGYLQGDGCLESSLKRFSFTDENIDQMKSISDMTYDLFNISGHIRTRFPKLSKKAVYTLEIGSVDVHRFIRTTFKMPVGVKINLSIPPQMYKHKDLLRWYLRGLFDADGTLPKDAMSVKQAFIDVTFKDKLFIEEIQKALLLFDIKTLRPYRRLAKSPHSNFISETWELRIRKKSDMLNFINEIGFFSQNKAKRTKLLLRRLKAPVAQPGY